MNKSFCYVPQRLDKKLSKMVESNPQFAAWTPKFFASLRGAFDNHLIESGQATVKYDDSDAGHSSLWDLDFGEEDSTTEEQKDNLKKVLKALVFYRNDVKKQQLEGLKAINDNKAEIWDTMSEFYGDDLNKFYNRAHQIAHYYIQAIDNFIETQGKKGIILSRQDVISGIPALDKNGNPMLKSDGFPRMIINSSMIFNAVFNRLMADYSSKMNDAKNEGKYNYIQHEFDKMFSPKVWAALLITTKAMLKNMEGLKVGLMEDVAEDIDISTLNDNTFSDIFDPEYSVREGWQVMTDCISAYGSLSKEVRKALSRIPITISLINDQGNSHEALDQVQKDDLGYPVRMNAVQAHQKLMEILRGVRSKEKMIKMLEANFEFSALARELRKDPVLATQFYNDFRKVFQPYVQISFLKDKITHFILNKTNTESAIGNYLFGIKYHPTKGLAMSSRFAWKQADVDTLTNIFKTFIDRPATATTQAYNAWTSKDLNTNILRALNALGITYSDSAINTLLGNMKKKSELVKALKKLASYSGLETESKQANSNFVHWLTFNADGKKSDNQRKVEDIISILQECGNGVVYESKCRTINSKGQNVTYYSDVLPSFMGDVLSKIQSFSNASNGATKSEQRAEYKQWLKDNFFKSSQFCDDFDVEGNPRVDITPTGVDIPGIKNFWLRELYKEANADTINKRIEAANTRVGATTFIPKVTDMFDSDSFTSQFSFMRITTGKINDRVTPFEDFTTKQHYQQMISSFFAFDTLSNGVMSDWVYTPVFVLGDSGVCKVLKTKRLGSVKSYQENNGKFDTNLVTEELYNIFESELKRMSLFKRITEQNKAKGIQTNSNIEKNASRFTMLTFLNKAFEGREFTKLTKDEVKKEIEKYLGESFEHFKMVGESTGAVSFGEDASKVNGKYNVTVIREAGKKNVTVKFEERLKEFYYNTYLSNLLQYQMFTGDLGYYKSVKDFQKRYKEIHAPGSTLDVEAVDVWNGNTLVCPTGKETAIYFNDKTVNTEEVNPQMMEVLLRVHAEAPIEEVNQAIAEGITKPIKDNKAKEDERQRKLQKLLGNHFGLYQKFVKETSQTDGQGFRGLKGFRKVEIMAGLWNDRLEALYKQIEEINEAVIRDNRNITAEELATIEAFKTDIQPLKPYMFTLEQMDLEDGTNDALMVPVQHKYSEDILIPCLLPAGSKIRKVAEYMRTHDIDLVAADTCVKVGMWGQTSLDENEDIETSLAKAKVHELNYEHYRIQSNVPNHINVERALGTQVRKLIMGNINMLSPKEYDYLGGKEFVITKGGAPMRLTGRNLVSLYTSLIVANMMQSFSKFKNSIEKEQELSNILTSAIVNNDRYSMHQLLDIAIHDGEKGPRFNTPLYEGAIEHDTTAMIFSLFRKAVNKQDMKGGAAVQVSDWGITTKDEVSDSERPLRFVTDENNENVLYAEVEIPFKFSYRDSNGKEVPLKFNDYCNTDGTFKMEDGIPKIEKNFPGMLDIIAYRIPSERDYSMLNCKVVRCTEPTAGGTIRVPAQGTTIAGFDFDIDKLYLIRKDHVMRKVGLENSYSQSDRNKIFAQIYESDAEARRDAEDEEEYRTVQAVNNEITDEIEKLGQDVNTYNSILDAFDILGLGDAYTASFDELTDEDKIFLSTQRIISGQDLYDYMESWVNDAVGFTEEDMNSIDKDKIYSGKDAFNIIFKNIENLTSKEGWKLFNNMEEFNYQSKDHTPESSIKSILYKIREDSGEYKDVEVKGKGGRTRTKRIYSHPLNYYWDTMIEQNPYMEDNAEYDKNQLFEKAAKDLGLWQEKQYEEKLIDYDYTKPVTSNSRVARNNLIFELMRHRLMDKETIKDRLTPGGFDNSKNSALTMRILQYMDAEEFMTNGKIDFSKVDKLVSRIQDKNDPLQDPEPSYDAADPSTLLFYNQLNQVAAKLIGIFANQNTNHQLSSVIRKLDLVKPIIFDGMIGAKINRSAENLAGLSDEQINKKVGSTLLAKEIELSNGSKVDVDLNLAEFLAASVDAVKDPVLNYLNFNTTTAATGALLARMGYSTRDIGILFNQPIIKDLCETMRNSNGIMQFNGAKKQVLNKYTGINAFPKEVNTTITSEELAAQIVKYRNLESNLAGQKALISSDKEFTNMQVSALKIFEEAYNASRELSQYIATTKYTAANAVGSTMGFFYNQRYTVENYINQDENMLDMVIYENAQGGKPATKSLDVSDKDMSDREAYMKTQWENPYAFEQCMYDLNRELVKVLEKYYPYDKAIYSERRDAVARFLVDGNVLDADTIDNIHRETSQHLLTGTNSAFNPSAICEEDGDYNNRDYYLYKFPLELFNEAIKENGKGIPPIIAQYINFSYSDYKNKETNTVTKQLHISVNLNVEQADKNTFTDAWAALAKGDEYQQKIAKGLFFHNYYKLGFNVGPFSFMQFTPLEVKQLLRVNDMSYLDYIDIDNLNNLDVTSNSRTPRYAVEFAYQYALNHTDNYQLVHRVSPELLGKEDRINRERFKNLFKQGLTFRDSFVLDLTSTSDRDVNSLFVKKQDNSGDYPVFQVWPIIMHDGKVYAAQVDGDYNNVTSEKVTYKRVQVLGKKGIYNTYAPTLNEALAMAESSSKSLTDIEASMETSLKEALKQNETDKPTSAEQQMAQESLATQQALTLETLDELPVVQVEGVNYADITSLLPSDIQQALSQNNVSTDTVNAAMDAAKALGIENAIQDNALEGGVKLYIDEAAFEKLAEKIENSGNEEAASNQGETFSDSEDIDVDFDALRERMMQCTNVNDNMVINAMLDLIEEKGTVIDRESAGENISKLIDEEVKKEIKNRKDAGATVSWFAAKVIRKEIIVDSLVSSLEQSIREGRKKVYTTLTREQIC